MKNIRRTLSIKTTIILIYIIIMVTAASAIAYVIFTRWSSSVEQTMERIALTVSEQIHDQIYAFMQNPIKINESNHKIIENGILDLSDEKSRDRFFVGVLTSQDEQIYSFSYGTSNGEYYGARRNEHGVVEIMRNDASTGGNSWYYTVNEDLTAGEISVKLGKFDARTRAWYKAAVEVGKDSFSPLYKHFVMDDLTVSAAWPVYDTEGILQGVFGTHMLLSDIGSYLEKTINNYHGYALIIEKNSGEMVANSMGIENFTVLQDGSLKRKHITDIQDSALHAIYQQYLNHQEDLNFSINQGNERLFVSIDMIYMEGVDWLVLSAIPGTMLFSPMFDSLFLTTLLAALTILLSSITSYFATRRLFKPIDDLLEVAGSISAGDLTKRIKVVRDDEIGNISKMFNGVADNLQSLITNLEARVQTRTEDLHHAMADLEENRDHLQLILDSTAEGIYGIDLNGNCTFCNLSSIRLLGYDSQEDLLGKDMHMLIHHCMPDGTPISVDKCKIFHSIQKGMGYAVEDEVFWRADGTSFDVAYHAYPQFNSGKIIGGVITFMDITERRQQEKQIEYLMCHDSLTGLYNRVCLEEHIANIDNQENLPMSVIFADLNGLKMTNDIFGHAAGDELIKKAAQILLQSSRQDDVVARIGGDEFIIILPKTDESQSTGILSIIRSGFADARVEAMKCSISLGSATKMSGLEKFEEVVTDAENEMYKDKTKNRSSVKKEIINTIQESLHAMSERERQHSSFVPDMCRRLGVELRLSATEINRLQRAAALHDIGKITLGRDLLSKDTLDEGEYELFKQHPAVGYRILNLFDDTLDLADSVYSHHERWDGNGYPRGLQGEQIPLLARIISIVEAYERVYNRGDVSESDRRRNALRVIGECAGTQFDPHIAHVFVQLLNK
jgi:diguanylate cyclase